jgi:hypothetical protein
MKIEDKDWGRMMDLVVTGKDGVGTAKIIKNKDKALARFIAGTKLSGQELSSWEYGSKEFYGEFEDFGNKAMELGATHEEIQKAFDEAIVPESIIEKMKTYRGKKLDTFIGDIVKKVMDAGYDVNHLPHNGNAMTMPGKDAMSRNGCNWTIGYKMEITKDSKTLNLFFDAVTDEGFRRPTVYLLDGHSSNVFGDSNWNAEGKLKFIKRVMEGLK